MWNDGWSDIGLGTSDHDWSRGTYGRRTRRSHATASLWGSRQNRLDYLDSLPDREWREVEGDDLQERLDRPFEVNEVSLGGIHNGGNSCYLAAALQAANAIPRYRDLFDSLKNELVLEDEESAEQYVLRQTVQRRSNRILDAITNGRTVSRRQINHLRTACVQARIVASCTEMADAAEVLERLLSLMGYQEPKLECRVSDSFDVDAVEEELDVYLASGNLRDPENYSTMEELRQGQAQDLSLEVSAFLYQNGCVDMQTLIDSFWGDESLSQLVVKRRDSEEGEWRYVRIHGATRSKRLEEESVLPEVLRITIQQHPTRKALIDTPLIIQATGSDSELNATYRLAAVIEHKARPPHYVAHLVAEEGSVVEADDGMVTQTNVSCLKGQAYYYVLVGEE